VWDVFIEKKLPRAILIYNRTKIANSSFVSYVGEVLLKFTFEFYKRKKDKIAEDIDADHVEKRAVHHPGIIGTPEDIVLNAEKIRFLINFIDKYKGGVEKKLIYHCKKLLIHYYCADGFLILSDFKKEEENTLIKTSNRIEKIYTISLSTQTDFMTAIEKEMCEKGIDNDEFLKGIDPDTDEGKQIIANRVNDINKSLMKFLEANKITYKNYGKGQG